MRVTCESCNAQYNLPDDKVRGRRAKVRCKKCQATIVVDGTSLVPAPPSFDDDEATQVMNGPALSALAQQTVADRQAQDVDADTWTVNLSETDQRDLTEEELVAGWLEGLVTDDAYVWREGLDDWTAIADVPEIVDKINAAMDAADQRAATEAAVAQAAAPQPEGPEAASAPAFPSPAAETAAEAQALPTPHAPETAAAEAPTPHAPTPKAAPAQGFLGGSADRLFGDMPSIEETKPLDLSVRPNRIAPPQQRPAGDGARRGPPAREKLAAREENSVLFSLDALTAGRKSEPPPASERLSEDLLMMAPANPPRGADAPLISVQAPEEPAPSSLINPLVPAPPVAAQPVAVATAAPALTNQLKQPAEKKGGGVKLLLGLLVLIAAIAGGLFAAGIIPGKTDSPAAQPTQVAAPTAAPAAEELEEAAPPAETSAAPETTAPPTPSAASTLKQPSTAAPQPAQKPAADRPTAKNKPVPAPASPSPASGDKPGDEKPGDEEATEEEEAPPFNAGAAKTALKAAAGQVQSCKATDGPTGVGVVQLTFANSGRVTSANVSGAGFGGTSVGGCIARTFRRSRVPKFSGKPVTVSKSFRIN